MSTSLRTIFEERVGSGVYRIGSPAGLTQAIELARRTGWQVAAVERDAPATKEGALAAFQAALAFPDWFGHNLDALADSLTDVANEPGTLLVWAGSEALAEADDSAYRDIVSVLQDRANDTASPRFVTLLVP